jgi:hypothetical protein
MQGILGALSILDARAYLIIAAILVVLVVSIGLSLYIRGRYAELERDLSSHAGPEQPFSDRMLTRILADARNARQWYGHAADHQASIEQHFQSELGGLLLGERFIRAAPGLSIIFGLVGTFYGLAISIGKMVLLVSGGRGAATDVGSAMTQGLTQSLSGMSVAFSTSLFGIAAAVVLTLFGVFANVPDRRTALMIAIETHLGRVLGGEGGARGRAEGAPMMAEFAGAVAALRQSVDHFDSALQQFATTTRDFHEFNHHLKDNVQRMSLSFSDLSTTLNSHTAALTGRRER